MSKQLGRTFLIKISDGQATPTLVRFGGLTAKSLKINGERIDATTPDPATPEGAMWRETLPGTKSVSVSGDCTIVSDAAEARAVAVAMQDDNVETCQIVVPGFGAFDGDFALDLEFGDDGKLTCSLSLESTGPVTYTPAA